MSKKFLIKLIGALIPLSAAVLWLLSILVPQTFGFFSLGWAGVLVSAGLGVLVLLDGLFEKNITTIKKLKIWIGVGLLIVALFALITVITMPDGIVLPIVAIILTVGLLLTLISTGGKNWDESDNHKVGYKNYFQRKKEEEKEDK